MIQKSLRQSVLTYLRRGVQYASGLFPKLKIPLTNSVVPTIGVTTPSFSRSTAATVKDHEGFINTALINELRFPGARRVRNLLSNTEVLSTKTVTVTSGSSYILSFSGTGSVTLSGAATGTLTGSTGRVQVTKVASSTSLTLTVSGSVLQAQLEKVVGTQTEASEYVSYGVLSWPYHGAGVDGVKYFTTDRDGNSLDVDGALIETSATNLITYSESLSNWSNNWGGGTTLTANAILGPHGRYAYKVHQIDSIGDGVYIAATLIATTHSLSMLIKNDGAVQSRMLVRDGVAGVTLCSLTFNWVNGVPATAVINNVSGIEYKELFNDWYLVTFSFVSVSSGMHQFILYPELVETATIGVYFGGLQVETGGSASSYIYTSGSITTKTEDSPVYSVKNIIQDVGSLYLEFSLKGLSSSTTYIMSIDDATSSNRINLAIGSGTTLTVGMISGGTSTVSSALMAVSKNNVYKIVVTYKNNSFNVYINGTLVLTDTSCTVPTTLSYLRFAKYDNSGKTNILVKDFMYYKEVLKQAEAERRTL